MAGSNPAWRKPQPSCSRTEAWLADCGFEVVGATGGRGYTATIYGLPGAQEQLLSAGSIAGTRSRW